MAYVLWNATIDHDQLIYLKMCFEECRVSTILNMNWKLLQNKRVIYRPLVKLGEQIDRKISMQLTAIN